MKRTQTDVAYDYIKNKIITKFYFPGSHLVEEELVRDTGVSRTSVRSALSRLRYEGIVDGSPNRGMTVKRFQREDMVNAFHTRQILETAAFELAVDRMLPDGIARMKVANQKLQELMDNFAISEYVEYNRKFHCEIAYASGNQYLQKYLDEIYNTLAVCLLFYNNTMEDRRSLTLHEQIIYALETKNVEMGKEAIVADNRCAIDDFSFAL